MKQKDMYTLDELYANLDISLAKLSKMAGITEPTLSRIRDGYSARVETINKLLKAFSEVYGIELSRDNVTGITLEDKKAIRRQMLARKGLTESVEKQPVTEKAVKTKGIAEKAEKRVYTRKQDSSLPDGCITATEFARNHGRNDRSFRDDMLIGLGSGTVPGLETHPVLGVRDHVDYCERQKPSRPKEKERYLTQEQQKAAFEFWQRHDVSFAECHDFGCWCHTFLQENN